MLPYAIPEGQVFRYSDKVFPAQLAEAFAVMEGKDIQPHAILVHPDILDDFQEWAKAVIDLKLEYKGGPLCDRIFLPEPTRRVGVLWWAEVFPHPVMKPGMVLVLGELPWSWAKGDPIDFEGCIIFQRGGHCFT